jgi:hypothetical protein
MKAFFGAIVLAALATSPAGAVEALADGSYEVRYRLELPHVEARVEETATVCLSDAGGASAFPVLSANNPLAHCPAQNIRRDGDAILFEIVCPGGGSAKAQGLFDLRKDGFEGRIAMNMGGKNMTMTEVQRGKRMGDCDPSAQPATH